MLRIIYVTDLGQDAGLGKEEASPSGSGLGATLPHDLRCCQAGAIAFGEQQDLRVDFLGAAQTGWHVAPRTRCDHMGAVTLTESL